MPPKLADEIDPENTLLVIDIEKCSHFGYDLIRYYCPNIDILQSYKSIFVLIDNYMNGRYRT